MLKAIRSYREKMGLTQEALAEKLGRTQQAIALWESGEREPKISMLQELAAVLGCTIEDLLKDSDKEDSENDNN